MSITSQSFKFLNSDYEFNVGQMNCLTFDCIQKSFFTQYYEPRISVKPRTPREKYIPPKGLKNKRNWNFNNSIFRTYKKDTDLLMENCFESDFSLGRYPGFVKDKKDFKKLREMLKKHYREIKQIYKYYSSYSGVVINTNP